MGPVSQKEYGQRPWGQAFGCLKNKCVGQGDGSTGPSKAPEWALRNELSEETNVLTQQKTLLGRGPYGEEQPGKGTHENCSAPWLTASGSKVRS